MVDFAAMANNVIPQVKILIMVVVGMIVLGGTAYYLFVVLNRKKWICRIFEIKADGKMHLIGFDILLRYSLENGQKFAYKFKKGKYFTSNPPTPETTYRVGNKEYVDYLRIGVAYFPMNKDEKKISVQADLVKQTVMQSLLSGIKKGLVTFKILKKDKEKMIYTPLFVPMQNTISIKSEYEPISYDLEMSRLATIDVRQQMYKNKVGFWQQYGQVIAWGLMIFSVIIVAYLSFEYMKSVFANNVNLCSTAITEAAKCSSNTPPPLT